MWRQANGSDALYEDCVGPSSYAKGQGYPVRVWGLLLEGVLFIFVLPFGEVMNRVWYAWIVAHFFGKWRDKIWGAKVKAYLVQDHEKCLWTPEPREEMAKRNIVLLENYPKCSQDLNPIETVWRELRARLFDTEPTAMETRDQFIPRMRNAVAWVNANRRSLLLELCSNQKAWAQDVLQAQPPGARTKH